jgi:hypothetical protein
MPTRELGFTDLLTAVYTRLTTHANTSSYSTYNHPSSTATLPYIVIGRPSGVRSEYENRSSKYEENIVQIDIFGDDEHMGDKQVADMMNNIVQALDSSALSISNYATSPYSELDFSDIVRDETEDGKVTYHGLIRWRWHMLPS